MSTAKPSVVEVQAPPKQTLERRLGLEHSMFWTTTFRTLRAPGGLTGLVIIVIMILISIFAPVLSPYDPLELHKGEQFKPPQLQFPFGTDEFGRDILSRTLYGGRVSLLAGPLPWSVLWAWAYL